MKEFENSSTVINKTKRNVLIKGSIILFYFFVSVIFGNKVSRLAIVTSQGIFGSSGNTWLVIYYFLIIISLLFFAFVYFIMFYNEKAKDANEKMIKYVYNIYDAISFVLICIVSFFVCMMFVLTPCTVNGDSMQNTFQDQDRLVVWHLAYKPKREDVVVVFTNKEHYNSIRETFILKRIVGVPNDELEFKSETGFAGDLYINNVLVLENLTLTQYRNITSNTLDNTYIIPKDRFLVLGDNRNNSTDSRTFGLVYSEDILGKVIFRTYPFNKLGNPNKNLK